MALRSTNRKVNMTAAGEVLLLIAASSTCATYVPGSHLDSEEHNHVLVLVVEPALLLRTPRRRKPSPESHSIYLRTARTAEQPSIGPAQSSKVHSEVHSFVSKERVKCRQDRRERGKEGEIEEGKEGTY